MRTQDILKILLKNNQYKQSDLLALVALILNEAKPHTLKKIKILVDDVVEYENAPV